ncbi:hypothetical protein HYQ46_009163 [Verticillium longisporum]|nr:hypothetical protein HYQ46_009163 [Verticillium longisporum]
MNLLQSKLTSGRHGVRSRGPTASGVKTLTLNGTVDLPLKSFDLVHGTGNAHLHLGNIGCCVGPGSRLWWYPRRRLFIRGLR